MNAQDAREVGYIVSPYDFNSQIAWLNAARYVMNPTTQRYEEEESTTTDTSLTI